MTSDAKTKKAKIKTLKIGITPSTNVVYKGQKYERRKDGKYVNKATKEVVKIVY